MDYRSLGEPVWTAEDEQTDCAVSCFFHRESLLYVVVVTKGDLEKVEYFPASSFPRKQISDKDLLQAKQIAVKLADEISG